MFTKDDYLTLTATQRRHSVRKAIVKHAAITAGYVTVYLAACTAIDKYTDSKSN